MCVFGFLVNCFYFRAFAYVFLSFNNHLFRAWVNGFSVIAIASFILWHIWKMDAGCQCMLCVSSNRFSNISIWTWISIVLCKLESVPVLCAVILLFSKITGHKCKKCTHKNIKYYTLTFCVLWIVDCGLWMWVHIYLCGDCISAVCIVHFKRYIPNWGHIESDKKGEK